MPRRLPEKTRNAPRKMRRRGSKRRFRSSRPIFQAAPVRENQELEVVIDDVGSKGDGVTRIQSYLIFVPNGKVGERIKVRIIRVGRKFAVAEKTAQREEKNEDKGTLTKE